MSKVSEELKDLATKSLSVSEFYEYSNKIADLVDAKPYKSTENAKNDQTTVKTRNLTKSEASFTKFRKNITSKIPCKATVSTPNPNKAFADHKYKMWKKKRGLPD